jgi:uncharacterized protein YdaU (DUF1376 family)
MAGNNLFMPVWIDAYHADTQHLSTAQHGAYLLIMMSMWRNGGRLPNDEKRLATIAKMTLDKWRRYGGAVMDLLVIEDGFVTQKRLLQELEKSRGKVEKKRAAGKAGGTANSLKNKGSRVADAQAGEVANAEQEGQQTGTIYSLLSTNYSPSKDVEEEGRAEPSDDDRYWREIQAELEARERRQKPADPPAETKPEKPFFREGVVELTSDQFDELKATYAYLKFPRDLKQQAQGASQRYQENKKAGKPEHWMTILTNFLGSADRKEQVKVEDRKAKAEAAKAEAQAKVAAAASQGAKAGFKLY